MQHKVSFNVAPLTFVVKWLIIVNVGIWFGFQVLLRLVYPGLGLERIFGLVPSDIVGSGSIWQIFTYMFLHSVSGVSHLAFNMLTLWMFGSELEQLWGRRPFLSFYLLSGMGAAVLYVAALVLYASIKGLVPSEFPGMYIPVLGASGALYALMVAHARLFGERLIYFFMIFPLKTKYFVLILGLIQFASLLTSSVGEGGVSYLAHLGGLFSGYLFLLLRSFLRNRNQEQQRKHKNRLRLVVDNEKNEAKDKNPRYWN